MPKTTRYTIKDKDGNVVDKSVTDFEPNRSPEKPGIPLQRELLELYQAMAGLDGDNVYPMPVSLWRRLDNQMKMERQQATTAFDRLNKLCYKIRRCIKNEAVGRNKVAWVCYNCGYVAWTNRTGLVTEKPPAGWDTSETYCPECENNKESNIADMIFGAVNDG